MEAWIAGLLERWKPATAHNRYRGLHADWAVLVLAVGAVTALLKVAADLRRALTEDRRSRREREDVREREHATPDRVGRNG